MARLIALGAVDAGIATRDVALTLGYDVGETGRRVAEVEAA